MIVLDGDSFIENGIHYRLFGVDSPELSQPCLDYAADCGEIAKQYLETLMVAPSCFKGAKDYYNRTLVVCYSQGRNIAVEMLKSGNAIALGKFYREHEVEVNFINPKKWRKK